MAESFGATLRSLRLAARLSQRELAALVERRLSPGDPHGFDVTYLSKLERGRPELPSASVCRALAAALAYDPDEFATLAGHTAPDIGPLLRSSPGARAFSRAAFEAGLSGAEWARLTALVDGMRVDRLRP